jgi:hypothetical protein
MQILRFCHVSQQTNWPQLEHLRFCWYTFPANQLATIESWNTWSLSIHISSSLIGQNLNTSSSAINRVIDNADPLPKLWFSQRRYMNKMSKESRQADTICQSFQQMWPDFYKIHIIASTIWLYNPPNNKIATLCKER